MPIPVLISLLLGILLSSTPALADSQQDDLDPARQAELETLLYQDCGSCHGMTLRGGLGPALPRDRMQTFSVDALSHIILHGIPGSAMPGWKALISEADARWIAEHLQTDNPLDTLTSQD
ncbi:cytochrome c [Halomonas campisalis]|uniref:Cytochrome c n=1 Tax=Billgrantia campisalis TaxID=74661 RepID=A0ABS9P532_9GAMM|nr:cytochrome c [Halomonas campisalis]MCG6656874.1 cytochrome c [Halomonas campisalis]MDR5862063.1 cytochrome c [Halomonas campisalis]